MLFTYNDKLKLKDDIKNLSKYDWIQIYNILKSNKEIFTINNNGLLFDLINISNDSLNKIKIHIENLNNTKNNHLNFSAKQDS